MNKVHFIDETGKPRCRGKVWVFAATYDMLQTTCEKCKRLIIDDAKPKALRRYDNGKGLQS